MMERKLVLLDLDGTILPHGEAHVGEMTRRAIEKALSNGHFVVIATGRTPSLFYGIDEKLGIDAYIAANGRYVKTKDRVLHCEYIPKEVVERLNVAMQKRGVALGYENENAFVVNRMTEEVEAFCRHFNLHSPRVDADFHMSNDVLQMIVFEQDSDLQAYQQAYPELDFNISCPYGLDVNISGGLKEYGMALLAKHLGIALKDTVAVGDGYNDIGMVERAGLGIAMGNACEPLKRVADFVTGSCHEDGVYAALVKAGVIE